MKINKLLILIFGLGALLLSNISYADEEPFSYETYYESDENNSVTLYNSLIRFFDSLKAREIQGKIIYDPPLNQPNADLGSPIIDDFAQYFSLPFFPAEQLTSLDFGGDDFTIFIGDLSSSFISQSIKDLLPLDYEGLLLLESKERDHLYILARDSTVLYNLLGALKFYIYFDALADNVAFYRQGDFSTYTPVSCEMAQETDGGDNPNQKGTLNNGMDWACDKCVTNTRLMEYVCNQGTAAIKAYDCEHGCFNGACKTDLIPPSVIITSPENGRFFSPNFTISGTVNDNIATISSVKIQVNNAQPATVNVINGGFSYAVSSLTAGIKTITVTAEDSQGNRGSRSVTITIDASPPTPPVVTDGGASTTILDRLSCSWASTDAESGIARYEYRITQDSTQATTIIKDWTLAGTNTSVAATGLNLQRGKTYYFSVKAINRAGLWSIGYSNGIVELGNHPPQVGTITPDSGFRLANQAVNFTATYTDLDGCQDLKYAYLLINTAASGKNCCYAYYDRNANRLYLRNDADTSSISGFAPGATGSIQNSYCKLDCANTTVTNSGNTLTIKWNITFKPSFKGQKNSYLKAKDNFNALTGWIKKGRWEVR